MLRRKTILLVVVLGTLALVTTVVRSHLAPDNFDFSRAWSWIRARQPTVFRAVKDHVIQSDCDVRAIGTTRGLPLFRLALSRKDVAHFADLHEKLEDPQFGVSYYAEHNRWRHARLDYLDRTYDVQIKSHGRNPSNHRNGKFISLSIKLPHGEQINNCRRFSLLIRDHFRPDKQIVFDLAKRFDLLMNQEHLVRVVINHWEEKLYFFDRRFNDALMETTGRPSRRIFGYGDAATRSIKSSILTDGEWDKHVYRQRFSKTLQELEYPASQHPPLMDRFVGLNSVIAEGRVEMLEQYFDMDYLASFEAVRMLAGLNGHSIGRGDNLYVFYDLANGKFYPAITRDASPSLMPFLPTGSPEFYVNHVGIWELPLFKLISRHDALRQRTYKRIHEFIRREGATIGEEHRRVRESFDKLSYYGWASVGLRRLGLLRDDFTTNNIDVLKRYLETSKPTLRATTSANQLLVEVTPNSLSALRFHQLRVGTPRKELTGRLKVTRRVFEYDDEGLRERERRDVEAVAFRGVIDLSEAARDLMFSSDLDENFRQRNTNHALLLEFHRKDLRLADNRLAMSLLNVVTDQAVEPVQCVVQQAPAIHIAARRTKPEKPKDWLQDHPKLKVTERADSVTIHAGDYILTHDLRIPTGKKLILEAGVTLRLAHDTSIFSKCGLDVRGTAAAPVHITAIDPHHPFGTVGILGGSRTKSLIHHLHLSHGHEDWIDGVYFSGALSIHDNAEVELHHSRVEHNHADDGLNVKYGRVKILHCLFRDNAADQVDLDVCQGEVRHCAFRIEERKDSNGDGLDVSLSRLRIEDNLFQGLADKGVSAGERSQVVCAGNVFIANNTAVATKDLTVTLLRDNQFQHNVVDVDAFQKKTIFGGGIVCLERPKADLQVYLDHKSSAWFTSSTGLVERLAQEFPGRDLEVDTSNEAQWRSFQATVETVPPWHLPPKTETTLTAHQ